MECALCKGDISKGKNHYVTIQTDLRICEICYSKKLIANGISINIKCIDNRTGQSTKIVYMTEEKHNDKKRIQSRNCKKEKRM